MGNTSSAVKRSESFSSLTAAVKQLELKKLLEKSKPSAAHFKDLLVSCDLWTLGEGESLQLDQTFLWLLLNDKHKGCRQALREVWHVTIDDEAFVALIRSQQGKTYHEFIMQLEIAEGKKFFDDGISAHHYGVPLQQLFVLTMITYACPYNLSITRFVRALGFAAHSWIALDWKTHAVQKLQHDYSFIIFVRRDKKLAVTIHVAPDAKCETLSFEVIASMVGSTVASLIQSGYNVIHCGHSKGARVATKFPQAVVFAPHMVISRPLGSDAICYVTQRAKLAGCEQSWVLPVVEGDSATLAGQEVALTNYFLGDMSADDPALALWQHFAVLADATATPVLSFTDNSIPLSVFPKSMHRFLQRLHQQLKVFTDGDLSEAQANLLLGFEVQDETCVIADPSVIQNLIYQLLAIYLEQGKLYKLVCGDKAYELSEEELAKQSQSSYYQLLQEKWEKYQQLKQQQALYDTVRAALPVPHEYSMSSIVQGLGLQGALSMRCLPVREAVFLGDHYFADTQLFTKSSSVLAITSKTTPVFAWVNGLLRRWQQGAMWTQFDLVVDMEQVLDVLQDDDDLEVDGFLNALLEKHYPSIQLGQRQQLTALLKRDLSKILCIVHYGKSTQAQLKKLKSLGVSVLVVCQIDQSPAAKQLGFEQVATLSRLDADSQEALKQKLPSAVKSIDVHLLTPYWIDMIARLAKQGVVPEEIFSEADLVAYWSRLTELTAEDCDCLAKAAFGALFDGEQKSDILPLDAEVAKRCVALDLLVMDGDGGQVQFVYQDVHYHFASLHLLTLLNQVEQEQACHVKLLEDNALKPVFLMMWPFLIANALRDGSPYKESCGAMIESLLKKIFGLLPLSIRAQIFNLASDFCKGYGGLLLVSQFPAMEMLLNSAARKACSVSINRSATRSSHGGAHAVTTGKMMSQFAQAAANDLGYDTDDMTVAMNVWVRSNGGFRLMEIPGTQGPPRESFIMGQLCRERDRDYVVAMLPNVETASMSAELGFAGLTYYLNCAAQAESRIVKSLQIMMSNFGDFKPRITEMDTKMLTALREVLEGVGDELLSRCLLKIRECADVGALQSFISALNEETEREFIDCLTQLIARFEKYKEMLNSLEATLIPGIHQLIQGELSEHDRGDTARFCLQKVRECPDVGKLGGEIERIEAQTARDQCDLFSNLQRQYIFLEENVNVKVLFSINLGNAHWATVEILIHKEGNNFHCDVYYYDPLYSGGDAGKMSDDHFPLVAKALQEGIRRVCDDVGEIKINNCENPYKKARQARGDGVTCGVLSTQDKMRRAKGQPLPDSYQEGEETPYQAMLRLRQEQCDMVELASHGEGKIAEKGFVTINSGRIKRYKARFVDETVVMPKRSAAAPPRVSKTGGFGGGSRHDDASFEYEKWKAKRDREYDAAVLGGLGMMGSAFY